MNNPKPLNAYAPLRKTLTNCIDTLEPCVLVLKSMNDAKLNRHIKEIVDCSRTCQKALAIIDNDAEEIQVFLPACEIACKKCNTVCKGVELDLFKKAVAAISECIVSIQQHTVQSRKIIRR